MLEDNFNSFFDDNDLKLYQDENKLVDINLIQEQFYINGKVPQIIPDDELFN